MLRCEPVLTEAALLLKREGHDADPLFELLARGVIRVALDLQAELEYTRDVPILKKMQRSKTWGVGTFPYRKLPGFGSRVADQRGGLART